MRIKSKKLILILLQFLEGVLSNTLRGIKMRMFRNKAGSCSTDLKVQDKDGNGIYLPLKIIRISSIIFLLIMFMTLPSSLAFAGEYDKTGTQWEPYLEWSLENPSYSGNPYDLIATVSFEHTSSGETLKTEMFYDGGNTWKFRFTGTKTGEWTFTTSSSDSDLDGKSGTVTIDSNPDPDVHGFVTKFDNKWGWQGTSEAFIPQFVMYKNPAEINSNPSIVDTDIQTFLVEHGFNGFHIQVQCRWFDINKPSYDDISDPNPDLRTFEILEGLIAKVHDAGGVVHIWAWGDEQRHMTPIKWGINGDEDKRLQRYIAARLGPIPGWTMGYGFDLFEWVTKEQLEDWHDYLHDHFGWSHFSGGRASGPSSGTDHSAYVDWNQPLDYSSYCHHRPTYDVYVAALNVIPDKPVFSEDRFRIRTDGYPEKDYDEEMTRRGLWISTMAGGVANIWGNLIDSPGDYSMPYLHPEWIKTYSEFFKNRFLKDMYRENTITDGYCLMSPTVESYIFYKEDTTSIMMNLSQMGGSQRAIAVDAKKEYAEIEIGELDVSIHTWNAPYKSDWAIAVGDFGEERPLENWESYEDPGCTTVCDLFNDQYPTIYMRDANVQSGSYRVSYYDAGGTNVETHEHISHTEGNLDDNIYLPDYVGYQPGMWHVKLYDISGAETEIADDIFTVEGESNFGNWWDSNYLHRKKITIPANFSTVPAGYTQSLEFDHDSLVTAGKSQSNGDDLRVVYWNGSSWTELDRILDPTYYGKGWNDNDTRILFKIQAQINAGEIDDNYYIYYGYSTATNPPASESNVWRYFNPLESTSGLTYYGYETGSWSIVGGRLRNTGGNDQGGFRDSNSPTLDDVEILTDCEIVSSTSGRIGPIFRQQSTGRGYITRIKPGTPDYRISAINDDMTYQECSAEEPMSSSYDVVYRFKTRIVGSTAKFQFRTLTGSYCTELSYTFPGPGSCPEYSSGQFGGWWQRAGTYYYDNYRVRLALSDEPLNPTLSSEEKAGVSPINKPLVFALYRNKPNPFTGKTEIRYQIPKRATVNLQVFDIIGRSVVTLLDGVQKPGYYSIQYRGTDKNNSPLPSGVYFLLMKADEFKASQKMVLLQ